MSTSGPIESPSAAVYLRVIRSSSPCDMRFGSQTTPPFAPPNGMSAMLHFHVIQAASAFTSSRETWGWYLIPPLKGPLASLYCTRYPLNILVFPSSILTGKVTLITFFGSRRRRCIPSSSFSSSAAILSCSSALANASGFLWDNCDKKGPPFVFTGFPRIVGGSRHSNVHRRAELPELGWPVLGLHDAAGDKYSLRPQLYGRRDIVAGDDPGPA